MRSASLVVMLCVLGCGKNEKAPAAGSAVPVAQPAVANDPSEAEYAALLIVQLKASGKAKDTVSFDPATHFITDGELRISTTNLYREYLALPAEVRTSELERIARMGLVKEGSTELTLEQARARLRPVVRASLYFDFEVQAGKKAEGTSRTITRPLGGGATSIGIGIDNPDSIVVATSTHFDTWKISLDDALAIALANLRGMEPGFASVAPGVWATTTHDNYDASRILLIDEIGKLGIAPPIVALVPNRDALFLASGKNEAALLAMAELAEKAAEEPRPIHLIPLCLGNKLWAECMPDVTPKVKERYRALAVRGWVELYEEQHDGLQQLVGEEVFVAKLTGIQHDATKKLFTYATWSKTVPTLLPRAEFIAFIDFDGADEDPKMLGMVPWDKVQTLIGKRLTLDESHAPPRWFTGDYFPTKAEIAKLGPVDDPFGKR